MRIVRYSSLPMPVLFVEAEGGSEEEGEERAAGTTSKLDSVSKKLIGRLTPVAKVLAAIPRYSGQQLTNWCLTGMVVCRRSRKA